MAKATLRVEGLKEVRKTLRRVAPRESRNIMRRLVTAIARQVRNDVRAAAPHRSGQLRKAIRSKRERGKPDVFEASVIVHLKKDGRPRAPHWHFSEFGTVKQKATPYIAPTVKEWELKLPRIYREEFGKQLEREMAKRAKKSAAKKSAA